MNFIFSNLNALILGVWIIFLIIVAVRYFKAEWLKNISYLKLFYISVLITIFYGLFVTWGQYYVWSISSDVTRELLKLPLSKEVPFPSYFEWTRIFFSGELGYFVFYIIGRIWLNIFITFLISGFLYFIFKIWQNYREGFQKDGPLILLILMISSGFPGILVSISLGFIFSILLLIFYYFKRQKEVKIESVFIISTLISLIFTNIILSYVL